jgi:DNA polymerase-3 subunit epsilon
MTRLLFFGTEATGLPPDDLSSFSDTDKFPRLVQLSFLLFDQSQKLIKSGNFIIKPIGFTIPSETTKIHGITQKKAISEGVSVFHALGEFMSAVIQSDYIIAHNLNFDFNIIGSEAVRAGFERQYNRIFLYKEKVCTMQTTTNLLKIPRSKVNGSNYKYPNLSELYFHLFGSFFEKAHNALYVTQACAECFFKLKAQGFYYVHEEIFAAI